MKRIAIFMNSLAGGGMERAMINLAKFLVSEGAKVDLLVASINGPLLEEVPENVNLINLKDAYLESTSWRIWLLKSSFTIELKFIFFAISKRMPKAVKAIPSLILYMKNNNPDLIMSSPATANLALLWAKQNQKYKGKIVLREATTLSKVTKDKNTLFFYLLGSMIRKWYNKADKIVCVSHGVNKDLSENFLVNQAKLKTIYNLIDINDIKNKSISTDYDGLIDSYGSYILSVGRLEKVKNYETLIRAYHSISDCMEENLVILGEGSERCNLEELISDLSLADRVFMPGYFVNPYPFIGKCEVFALSSIREGCPNVIREAKILNKKIICTDCAPGIREALGDSSFSGLVEVGDMEALSQSLQKMVGKKEKVANGDELARSNDSMNDYRELFALN